MGMRPGPGPKTLPKRWPFAYMYIYKPEEFIEKYLSVSFLHNKTGWVVKKVNFFGSEFLQMNSNWTICIPHPISKLVRVTGINRGKKEAKRV